MTASVIKILTENGRVRYGTVRYGTVRYGTVRYGVVDKFGAPTVLINMSRMQKLEYKSLKEKVYT